MTHDPKRLRDRISRLYRKSTGADDERGSIAWLADQLGVARHTVSRWLMDPEKDSARRPMPIYLKVIEGMERDAGLA